MIKELLGQFIVILGPAGSGKSTLQNMMVEKYPKLRFAISCTTRPIRDYERNKINYYFLTKSEFDEKLKNEDLLEYAIVHKKYYYGLLKSTIIDSLKLGNFLIKDIEFVGLEKLNKILPKKNFKSIFIMPPSNEEIVFRLKNRAEISDEEITRRLESLKNEMRLKDNCDVIFEPIFNDLNSTFKKFEKCFFDLTKIDKNKLK